MMRFRIVLTAIVVPILSANARAAGDLGIGLMVGEPTGLSVKYWLDDTQAIDGAAGWSFSGHNSFQLHGDYLFHRFDIFKTEEGADRTPVYYGIGARIKDKDHDDDTVFGIRIPLGASYLFADAPFEIFGEIVPIIDLAPDVDLDINVAIGFRFYLD
jgi:hypothetical protein